MNTWWWVALAAVVLLALVASVVDGWGRGGRGPRGRRPGGPVRPRGRAPQRTRPPTRAPARARPGGAPRPGEIWWADVPYEDGPGSKDRPCLVLSVRGGTAVVAKITSRHHAERPGVIALAAGAVGDAQGRRSFLETDELRDVAVSAFRRKAGDVEPGVWNRVRGLA
ncbi:type II toxin-antitoxin system PemK/MazF family toxin [Streptomyces halstedii]|uniref:type II toxin-antitoxin system PemK/MazF family toxin n=1 Tax=Streptomyces TaxID=1883 RepID=UPI00048C0034|nr:type II toxin-antitoxin system PemK/MazF family toxin [Streptomyces sp. SID4912]MYY17196.1 type II toxin-antitoxin system PemK/MazF family toxin [Streptomyces sp. SID4912]